ncbi:carboxypeptidase-like regulatory domain-containing protein [Myroides phaeus]|uniref:carboxypeptidase-like regulatory domain-containing protein n=1 Tax=Myroides phaeus TaxID=702745 RepID=UPI002DBA0D23|nr:carboxypeptidase-like regulatory domain-containing protein [Myroides phaeus]MEC4115903.1 carboxypeptidase-like regulatory domain-containing protein [Myroides phaeus]
MRNFTVFLFLILTTVGVLAQDKTTVSGTILNDKSFLPIDDVNVINITKVKGTISKRDGSFSVEASLNDSIHFSYPGYVPIKLKVTNDWINNDNLKVYFTEQSIELDEIVIKKFDLTGYLEVDTKLIALNEKMQFDFYRRNQTPYYGTAMGTFFSPVDVVYNLFKGKSKKLKKLEAIKEDQNMIALMQTRYDREIVCGLLDITREDIVKSLQNCNYSDKFIYTATDFQIYQALSDCFENSKVLATKKVNTSN